MVFWLLHIFCSYLFLPPYFFWRCLLQRSHIPYLLHFLVDNNLYGMNYIDLSTVTFRRPLPRVPPFLPRRTAQHLHQQLRHQQHEQNQAQHGDISSSPRPWINIQYQTDDEKQQHQLEQSLQLPSLSKPISSSASILSSQKPKQLNTGSFASLPASHLRSMTELNLSSSVSAVSVVLRSRIWLEANTPIHLLASLTVIKATFCQLEVSSTQSHALLGNNTIFLFFRVGSQFWENCCCRWTV